MASQEEFFDLVDILMNEVVGDPLLFCIIGFIGTLIFALRANNPFQVSLLMAIFWLLVYVVIVQNLLIFGLVLLFIAVFFVYQIWTSMR